MKPRPEGFLRHLYGFGATSRDAEIGDYIAELHAYLWGFVWQERPGAAGTLEEVLPERPPRPWSVRRGGVEDGTAVC